MIAQRSLLKKNCNVIPSLRTSLLWLKDPNRRKTTPISLLISMTIWNFWREALPWKSLLTWGKNGSMKWNSEFFKGWHSIKAMLRTSTIAQKWNSRSRTDIMKFFHLIIVELFWNSNRLYRQRTPTFPKMRNSISTWMQTILIRFQDVEVKKHLLQHKHQ